MNIETASVQAFSEIFPETVLDQRFDEALAIRIIHEDQFAPVTAIHDVINRASILDSQLADQTGEWLWPLYVSISRTDPFLMYQYQEPTPFRPLFIRARQLLKIEVRDHVIVGREKPSYLSST